MSDKKKHKDKKDKKKHKDRKDKKKKERKRARSSDSSSSSSSSSSPSRQRSRKKQKHSRKQKKQAKTKSKVVNPYDFDQPVVNKGAPVFPPGLVPAAPGFSLPILQPTPPPPSVSTTTPATKPRSKESNIFKILPKLPYGSVLVAKTIYSTSYIDPNTYNCLLKRTLSQIESKAKEENHKKAISTLNKCITQIDRQISLQQQSKQRDQTQMQNQDLIEEKKSNGESKASQGISRFEQLQRDYLSFMCQS